MKAAAQSIFIDQPEGRVHLRRTGEGSNLIIALHGFGLSGAMFSSFAKRLDPLLFSCLAFDLPGHGQTRWKAATYSPEDLASLVAKVKNLAPWSSVQLLGFSLGGRIWVKLLSRQLCPLVNGLTLVAPDGFGGRYTAWIDGRLGHLLSPVSQLGNNPRPWIWMARQLEKRRVISSFARHFVETQLNDPDSRQRLQLNLRSLRQFRLEKQDYSNLGSWAQNHPTEVWVGRRDPIVRRDRLAKIFRQKPAIQIKNFPGGHQLPLKQLAERFKENLPLLPRP